MKNRITYLDSLRGLAEMAVLVCHVIGSHCFIPNYAIVFDEGKE